jgi:hypothetical protein
VSRVPVDATAFATFDMQPLDAAGFDAGLESAGDELAVVFFWGLDCFNCEIARKAMLARPGEIRALGLRWFHSSVYEHRNLGRRFLLHGVPTWFFSIAAGGSGGRRAGMGWRSFRPPWGPRARSKKSYRPHRFQGLEIETGGPILRTGMNFGRSAR